MVLGGFVGGFGWFWVVLGRFGWFWVVPCFSNYDILLGIWKLFLCSSSSGQLDVNYSDYQSVNEGKRSSFDGF